MSLQRNIAAEYDFFNGLLAATKSLRVGWNLCCALARVRGHWQIVGVDEVYPK